jgi:hypothetical protein
VNLGSVVVGDTFHFAFADFPDIYLITEIDSDTSMVLLTAPGDAVSTTYGVIRSVGETVDFALFDGRIAISDGTHRWHWYGATEEGTTSASFEEHGLPVLTTPPTVAVGSTLQGALSAGSYVWKQTQQDKRGVESNPVETQRVTAAAGDTATLSAFARRQYRATKTNIYRSRANGAGTYRIWKDIDALRLASGTSDGTTSEIVFDSDAQTIETNVHKFREATYKATTNSYPILSNSQTSMVLAGDISAESTTDDIYVRNGVLMDYASTGDIVDLTSDADLDFTKPAPTHNLQGETGAQFITAFDDRLAWVVEDSQVEISGRGPNAYRWLGVNDSGRGSYHKPEYEYMGAKQPVRRDDKKPVVGMWEMDNELYCGRQDGFFGMDRPSDNVLGFRFTQRLDYWSFIAPHSVAVFGGITYCLASRGGEYDIIQFDGYEAISVGQAKIKTTLDGMIDVHLASGVVFNNMYWLSYTPTGGSGGNSRTIRYYIGKGIFDKQPWGCGVFVEPFEVKSENEFLLYCAAPTAVGHIYECLGSNEDLGGVIQRLAVTGAMSSGQKAEWYRVAVSARNA